MKFIILGSGGCVCLPKPLCQCRVCAEARKKGGRYKRYGCSLYFEDLALIVDTPEDIAHALNAADVRLVDRILYTHHDPDHTMGIRILEQLRLEWLDYYENIPPRSTVDICAMPEVMATLDGIGIGYGSIIDYYVGMGLAMRKLITQPLFINGIIVIAVAVDLRKPVSVFIFEGKGRKVIYAPCDCKPFPIVDQMRNADFLIIGNTFIDEECKDNRMIHGNHPLRQELHSIDDVLKIKADLSIANVIITHIEETWGKSYDELVLMEETYPGVRFAYDRMVVEV